MKSTLALLSAFIKIWKMGSISNLFSLTIVKQDEMQVSPKNLFYLFICDNSN